jgi:hypothetical protein
VVKIVETTVMVNTMAYEFDSAAEAAKFKRRIEAGGNPRRHAYLLRCMDIYGINAAEPRLAANEPAFDRSQPGLRATDQTPALKGNGA